MGVNKDNFTIRHYRGLIRDLEAQLKDALARIKKLELKVKSIPIDSPTGPSNMEMFSTDDINRGVLPSETIGGTGGGLSAEEIKSLVIDWINNGELPISLHDHTSEENGGDAFGALGASLQ